jgi:hypothetical protein
VDELIVGSGDTISGKVLHALHPHRDFCSFCVLCACLEDMLAILADATHTSRAVVLFHVTSTTNWSEPERSRTHCSLSKHTVSSGIWYRTVR